MARRLVSRFQGTVYHSAGSSVNSYVLPPSEVFGPPKVIIIMQQVYALPYNAHTERYIYTFTFKLYAGPIAFVMFRKILSGTSKRIQYFIQYLSFVSSSFCCKLNYACTSLYIILHQARIERDPQNCLRDNFWVIRKSCRWGCVSKVKYFTHLLLEQSHKV